MEMTQLNGLSNKQALEGKEILIKPNSPTKGLTVAFIIDNGVPIELLQFDNKDDEIWPADCKFK